MHPSHRYAVFDALLIVGSPLLLAVVETVHPQPHDLMNLNVRIWLTVHYAQIALFPLAALAVVRLVRGLTDFAAVVCRIAMFIFAASWTAWDAVAGLATGILVEAAQKSQSPNAWRDAVRQSGVIRSWVGLRAEHLSLVCSEQWPYRSALLRRRSR